MATAFLPPVSYSVGHQPNSVTLGDFNADGYLDALSTNEDAFSVSVLLNKGDGTFAPQMVYAVGGAPSSADIGDVNSDGKLDVVVADAGSDAATILIGRGDGTFDVADSIAVGAQPVSIKVGDLNSDDKLDIVTANMGWNESLPHYMSVLLGHGNGTFMPPKMYLVGGYPSSVALGDLNGDGSIDIVVANDGSADVSVFLNSGNGSNFSSHIYPAGFTPSSVSLGRLSPSRNYSAIDIVIANSGDIVKMGKLSVLAGHGDGTFEKPVQYLTGNESTSVALGDLTGSGQLDTVVANYLSASISVLMNKGDGTFSEPVTFAAGPYPSFVALGDVNSDGKLDAIVSNENSDTISVIIQL